MALRDPRFINLEASTKREKSVQNEQERQADEGVGYRPELRADPNQGQRTEREKAQESDAKDQPPA